MANATTCCDNCGTPIVNSTTRVVTGSYVFCCPNCSARMEGAGGGSNPQPPGESDLRCAHCGVPIVDETTMTSRGDEAFCCPNCAAAAGAPIQAR